jgi:hypothetical protein
MKNSEGHKSTVKLLIFSSNNKYKDFGIKLNKKQAP